jgi:DNA-binding response OmpR family regulator
MHVLIVEDSDSIRSMIHVLMTASGHEVEAVSTGAKGLDAALTRRPDAILLDFHLPGPFDGLEVCRRIRQTESTRAIPIVVIGARADDAAKASALDAGATAYYTKPFSPTALLKEFEAFAR